VYGVCVVTSDKNSEKGAMATCRRKNGVVVLLCVCVLCIYVCTRIYEYFCPHLKTKTDIKHYYNKSSQQSAAAAMRDALTNINST